MSGNVSDGVLRAWQAGLQEAMVRANQATERVDRERDRVKKWCADSRYTEFQTRQKVSSDFDFADALDSYRRWSGEVQRFAAAIQAEAALRRVFPAA